MNTPSVITLSCLIPETPPVPAGCSDPLYAALNPGECSVVAELVLRPAFVRLCPEQEFKLKVYTRTGGVETLVTGAQLVSSNASVAMVSSDGSVIGVEAGTANVSVTHQGMTATARVVVNGTAEDCCEDVTTAMVILVDNSRSMSSPFNDDYPSRLALAKTIAADAAGFADNDSAKLTLGVFSDGPPLIYGPPVADNSDAVAEASASITQSQKLTLFRPAFEEAVAALKGVVADLKVIMVISDGEDQEVAYSDQTSPLVVLDEFKAGGGVVISIGVRASSLGFGLLQKFATEGYFFINAKPSNVARLFPDMHALMGMLCFGSCESYQEPPPPQGGEYDTDCGWPMPADFMNLSGIGNLRLWDVRTFSVWLRGTGLLDSPSALASAGRYLQLRPSFNYNLTNYGGIPRGWWSQLFAGYGMPDDTTWELVPRARIGFKSGVRRSVELSGAVSDSSGETHLGFSIRHAGGQVGSGTAGSIYVRAYFNRNDSLPKPVVTVEDVTDGEGADETRVWYVAWLNENGETDATRITATCKATSTVTLMIGEAPVGATAYVVYRGAFRKGGGNATMVSLGGPAFSGLYTDNISNESVCASMAGAFDAGTFIPQPKTVNTTGTRAVFWASPAITPNTMDGWATSEFDMVLPEAGDGDYSDCDTSRVHLEIELEGSPDQWTQYNYENGLWPLLALSAPHIDDVNWWLYTDTAKTQRRYFLQDGFEADNEYWHEDYTGEPPELVVGDCSTDPIDAQTPETPGLQDIEDGWVPGVVYSATVTVKKSCAADSKRVAIMGSAVLSPGEAVEEDSGRRVLRLRGSVPMATVDGNRDYDLVAVALDSTVAIDDVVYVRASWDYGDDEIVASGVDVTQPVRDSFRDRGVIVLEKGAKAVTQIPAVLNFWVDITFNPDASESFVGQGANSVALYKYQPNAEITATGSATSSVSEDDAKVRAEADALAKINELLRCMPMWLSTSTATADACAPGTYMASLPTATRSRHSVNSQEHADELASTAAKAAANALRTCTESNNDQPITIPALGNATPFPSLLYVAGGPEVISSVVVEIAGINHSSFRDIAVALQAPNGTTVLLWRASGSVTPVSELSLTIDDSAADPMPAPNAANPTSGEYAPQESHANSAVKVFGLTGNPLPPQSWTYELDDFAGLDSNGYWRLWVTDTLGGSGGTIDRWRLIIS
jgi:subtilisin-like proprotein convertase family protein